MDIYLPADFHLLHDAADRTTARDMSTSARDACERLAPSMRIDPPACIGSRLHSHRTRASIRSWRVI